MVTVPVAPQVLPSGQRIRSQDISTNEDMFGGAIGRGLSALGEGVARFGAVLEANKQRMQSQADTASANDAFFNAAIAEGQAQASFLATTGVQATTAYPKYVADLQKIRENALNSLATPEAKAAFDNDFRLRMLSAMESGATHAATQHKNYVTGTAQARIDLAINDSATKFGDDKLFAQNQAVLAKLIAEQADVNGWSAEQAASTWVKARSKAWQARLLAWANADPISAQRQFYNYKDALTPEDAIQLDNTIRDRLQSAGVGPVALQALNGTGGTNAPLMRSDVITAISGGADMRLSASANQMLAGIQRLSGVPNLRITSGYRSPERNRAVGGAKASQHIQGNAVDIDLTNLTNQQKAQVLMAAIQSGANGIGIYGGGRSMHVDTRNAPAFWGPGANKYKGVSIDSAPEWAKPALRQLFSNRAIAGAVGGVPGVSLYQRVIGAESGGVSGLVSPKGAMGVMQVKPDTARMVASKLGIPYDPGRLLHDPNYNMLIGTTYLNMMLSEFGGNEVLAVAAYNAGPGRVHGWLRDIGDPRTGAISLEAWVNAIPIQETRDYVAKVMGAAGPAPTFAPVTGRSTAAEIEGAFARGAALAEQVAPGNVAYADAVRTSIEARVADMKRAETLLQEENWQALMSDVLGLESGTPLTSPEQLTAEMKDRMRALPPAGERSQKSLLDTMKANASGDATQVPTKEQVRIEDGLRDMALFDNAKFQGLDVTTFDLTIAQMRELVKLQHEKLDDADKAKVVDTTYAMNLAEIPLFAAGIADPASDEYQQFRGAYTRQIERWKEQNKGKQPSDADLEEMARLLLTQVAGEPSWSEWLFSRPDPYRGRLFTMPAAQVRQFFEIEAEADVRFGEDVVPTRDRIQIIEAFTRATGEEPTEAQIWSLFVQGQAHKEAP